VTYKPTLCLDFDGVLHSYSKWSEDIAGDLPVEGAQRFCKKAQAHFTLVVYSSRCYADANKIKIEQWLKANRFPEMEVTCMKPIAFLTLDDRAVTFTGTFPRVSDLLKFEPWWKKGPVGDADTPAVCSSSEEEA
jgi:hypothetical protein